LTPWFWRKQKGGGDATGITSSDRTPRIASRQRSEGTARSLKQLMLDFDNNGSVTFRIEAAARGVIIKENVSLISSSGSQIRIGITIYRYL
jgi:hypothetical protein